MVRPKARSGVSGAASAVADDGASARQRGAVRVGFEGLRAEAAVIAVGLLAVATGGGGGG